MHTNKKKKYLYHQVWMIQQNKNVLRKQHAVISWLCSSCIIIFGKIRQVHYFIVRKHDVWAKLKQQHTVEPRYVELCFLKYPAISKCFSFPLAQINPVSISNFITFWRNTGQHQSGSAVKVPPHKMYWKLTNVLMCSWKQKQSQTDCTCCCEYRRRQAARVLLILGIKLLLQKFDANLAISNPRYLELFLETLDGSQ